MIARSFRGLPQSIRFVVVGGFGTAVHYLIFGALAGAWGVRASVASAVGALGGALVNYYLNYIYTFSSSVSHWGALPKFYVSAGVAFCLNGLLMVLLTDIFEFNKWISQICATILCLGWNFVLAKNWVYK
jgi:putative flippase GtrA